MVDTAVCPPTDALITELKCFPQLTSEALSALKHRHQHQEQKDESRMRKRQREQRRRTAPPWWRWGWRRVMLPQRLWWIWHLGLCDHICSGCISFRSYQGAPPPNLGPTQPDPAVSQGPAPALEPPSPMNVISVRSPDYMKVGHLRRHLHENIRSKQDFVFSFGS